MHRIYAPLLICAIFACDVEEPGTTDLELPKVYLQREVPKDLLLLPPGEDAQNSITCRVFEEKIPGAEDACGYKCPDGTFGLCWKNPAGSWDCSECVGAARTYCQSWTSNSGTCPYL